MVGFVQIFAEKVTLWFGFLCIHSQFFWSLV